MPKKCLLTSPSSEDKQTMPKSLSNSNLSILPDDDELCHREKVWMEMFDKFMVDEGTDPEVLDDYYEAQAEAHDAEEFDRSSDTNDEVEVEDDFDEDADNDEDDDNDDDFDVEKVGNQMLALVKKRVSAWPKKGVKLLLTTVDPSVTVAEWIQANSEFTTTTTEMEKTFVDTVNQTITKTSKRTTITKQTIQMKMPSGADTTHTNQLHTAENIIKSICDASNQQETSNFAGKKKVNTNTALKKNKPKIPKEPKFSIKQESSGITPPGKSVAATSANLRNKLQPTTKVMPDRNEAQSSVKNEYNITAPKQEPIKKLLRPRGLRRVNADSPSQSTQASPRNSSRKRKSEDTKRIDNKQTDSITRLPTAPRSPNSANRRSYVRLSNVLPTNTESPSSSDTESEDLLQMNYRRVDSSFKIPPQRASFTVFDSSSDSEVEVDMLTTNYWKLFKSGKIF